MPIALAEASFDPVAVARTLADLPGLTLAILIALVVAVGFYRGWWVFGWLAREWKAERDSARVENAQLRATVSRLTARLARERPQRSSDPHDG